MSDKAKVAIAAILKRVQRDPRVAYYICPMSDSYEKLVAAHCDLNGLDESEFHKKFDPTLNFEPPKDTALLIQALQDCLELLRYDGYSAGTSATMADAEAALAKAGVQ